MRISARVAVAFWCLSACATSQQAPDGAPPPPPDAEVPRPDAAPLPDAAPDYDATPGCFPEICRDGQDDDCDGQPDDGCPCQPTEGVSCYSGPAATRSVGACHDGTMLCMGEEGGEVAFWGPCGDEQVPAAEVCDAEQLDEDCDGTANEDCDCVPGSDPTECGTDEGVCALGSQECIDGHLGPCEGGVSPGVEECDNEDDDCDGAVDEELVRACGTSEGRCEPGEQACTAGEWGLCIGGIEPIPEICNDVDDDCDAFTDEETAVACGTETGLCVAGTSECVDGVFGACMGGTGPVGEICNNMDDDCDGTPDDGLTRPCGTDVGVCTAGTETCAGGVFGGCTAVGPATAGPSEAPSFCDGLDSDCDGNIDDGCVCTTGDSRACGTDTGECTVGTQSCAGGAWGPCSGVGIRPEICINGLDEDCDGTPDDGCTIEQPPVVTCSASPPDPDPLDTVTLNASATDPDGGPVSYAWVVTTRPPGSTSLPATPASPISPFQVDVSGDYLLTVTATDDEGDTGTCTVPLSVIPPQDLHIELTWDTEWGDADLHLLPPSGSTATDWYRIGGPTDELDCFFANPGARWPPPGGSGDATLDVDDRQGFGPENISVAVNPTAGTYKIGVAYYCSHYNGFGPPALGDGPTDATVRIYCDGTLEATYPLHLEETGSFVYVADIDWPTCAGTSINDETYTALVQTSGLGGPVTCTVICDDPSDCTPGETCTGGQCVLD